MEVNNYQKYYQNKIGTAFIDIKKAIAGEKINCILTYEVGELGIDDSGALKVLFRIASDVAEPQFSDEKKDNFVQVSCSNRKIKTKIDSRSEGIKGKMGVRPWSRGFRINFSGNDLKKGDKVYIKFKNWRMQTFCESNFEFKILIDPFATDRNIELPKSSTINIAHGNPQKLIILAPSKVEKAKNYSSLLKLEDKWGNPCYSLSGEFEIINYKEVGCVSKVKFKGGKAVLKINPDFNQSEVVFIKGKFRSLRAVSNPIVLSYKNNNQKHFWAELHAQSEETVGTSSIDSYFNFAKNYAFVDIVGHQGNDFQISNNLWKKINQISSSYNKTGEFVTFPGYEWSGNTSKGGDRNIYYLDENQKIHRSSHALIDDYSDIKDDASSVQKLFRKIKNNRKVLVAAHVGGRRADIDIHESKVEKLIEVHSCWGTFEWFLFEALKKNYIVGFTAGSDGHDGRPGASYPGASHFANGGGLTCVLAKKLDRKNIFQALNNCHCYATTGARIFLDVVLKDNNKSLGIMGDVVFLNKTTSYLSVSAIGTSLIERVEIYNKDRIIKTFFPFNTHNSNTKYIKIAWKGSGDKGRDRSKNWLGEIHLQKCKIVGKVEAVSFLNFLKNKFKVVNPNKVVLESETSGNMQALILPVKRSGAKGESLRLKINGKTIIFPIDKIKKSPKRYKFDGLDSFVEICETSKDSNPSFIKLEEKITKLNKGINSIFVKITQRDGNIAWSSPIFIKRE